MAVLDRAEMPAFFATALLASFAFSVAAASGQPPLANPDPARRVADGALMATIGCGRGDPVCSARPGAGRADRGGHGGSGRVLAQAADGPPIHAPEKGGGPVVDPPPAPAFEPLPAPSGAPVFTMPSLPTFEPLPAPQPGFGGPSTATPRFKDDRARLDALKALEFDESMLEAPLNPDWRALRQDPRRFPFDFLAEYAPKTRSYRWTERDNALFPQINSSPELILMDFLPDIPERFEWEFKHRKISIINAHVRSSRRLTDEEWEVLVDQHARLVQSLDAINRLNDSVLSDRYQYCIENHGVMTNGVKEIASEHIHGRCPGEAAAVPPPPQMMEILDTTFLQLLPDAAPLERPKLLSAKLMVSDGVTWSEATPSVFLDEPFVVELRYDQEPDFDERSVEISVSDKLTLSVVAMKTREDALRFVSDEQFITADDLSPGGGE